MTRFEQIAAAYPLHCQRIAECVFEQDRDEMRLRRFLTAPSDDFDLKHGAGAVLAGAFTWHGSTEGHDYWSALRQGAR